MDWGGAVTRAGEAVPDEAVLAGAPVGPGRVDAVGVQVAVVVFPGTFVLIWRRRRRRDASPPRLFPGSAATPTSATHTHPNT